MTTTTAPKSPTLQAKPFTTLVVGATGATGRQVVRQLLSRNRTVVICPVRSGDKLLRSLGLTTCPTNLTIYERSVLEISNDNDEFVSTIGTVDAIVSCLGHNLSITGIWGRPRRLVKDSIERLVELCQPGTILLLMSSDGVFVPSIDDPRTSWTERFLFCLIRYLLPPHADNEAAATFLLDLPRQQQQSKNDKNAPLNSSKKIEWVIIRPTNLINEDNDSDDAVVSSSVSSSESLCRIYTKPPSGGVLLGNSNVVSRTNVAKFMVDLLTDEKLFDQYKFTCPVLHNSSNNNVTTNASANVHPFGNTNIKAKTL